DDQSPARGGGLERTHRGARRLAHAALAAHEEEDWRTGRTRTGRTQCSSPSKVASIPVTFMSFGEMAADSPPRWRSRISRIRATMSASSSSNSAWLISPSSTRICASSRRSRSTVSSLSSVSTPAPIFSGPNRTPEIRSESMMSMAMRGRFAVQRRLASRPSMCPFQFQPDVDEIVRRPRPGVLEGELLVLLADFLDAGVEGLLHLARHEERRVHDHAVADRLVGARGDRHVAQRAEDLGHVALGARLQGGVDQPAVLHAREIGRALLRGDLALQPPDVLVL